MNATTSNSIITIAVVIGNAVIPTLTRGQLARDAHRKALGPAAKFECHGLREHSGCGVRCRRAQYFNGIDV